jgi:hypothetical protein
MDDYKPNEFAIPGLRHQRNRVSLPSKGAHRCTIETKLRRKTRYIQPKHRLSICNSIIPKMYLAIHSGTGT